MKKEYDGISESCDTINAYIVHMGGDYKKTFERVKLAKLKKPTSFKGLHDLHLDRKRRGLPRFKKRAGGGSENNQEE
jgi:hypothetical protein